MKTAVEVEQLKKDWESDPCWDLHDTEGFEEHKEELRQYQEQKEVEWKAQREQRELELDAKAEELGVKGLYRLIIDLQERHGRAIEFLTDGHTIEAYKALTGRYPE